MRVGRCKRIVRSGTLARAGRGRRLGRNVESRVDHERCVKVRSANVLNGLQPTDDTEKFEAAADNVNWGLKGMARWRKEYRNRRRRRRRVRPRG